MPVNSLICRCGHFEAVHIIFGCRVEECDCARFSHSSSSVSILSLDRRKPRSNAKLLDVNCMYFDYEYNHSIRNLAGFFELTERPEPSKPVLRRKQRKHYKNKTHRESIRNLA